MDGVSVHIEPAPSTTSRASLSSIVFGGFVGCMQPIKFAFSSFHNREFQIFYDQPLVSVSDISLNDFMNGLMFH